MKILILNWKDIRNPAVGGAEVIIYELAKRLVLDGHNVTWYCKSYKGAASSEVIDGITIIRRGNLVTTFFIAPIYYWSLHQKPDVILDASNTICWQTPLWAWKSLKVAYLNQLAREVFFYEFPPLIAQFGYFIEVIQYLFYRTTKFVCYANSTKKDLESMGIPSRNIFTFSLGLDRQRYKPGKKDKNPHFICVNRLVRMKRTDLAVRAMVDVVLKYPKAKLTIIGTGYERANLQALRNSLNLQNNVFFADENTWFFSKNSKDAKLKLMQSAWVLVFPSVKEGWGMTVTECAACGTPAIVTDVTGLRDSVINGKTGIVLSSNPAVSEISNSILSLIENKQLLQSLSKQCVEHSKKFSWETSYNQFVNIFLP